VSQDGAALWVCENWNISCRSFLVPFLTFMINPDCFSPALCVHLRSEQAAVELSPSRHHGPYHLVQPKRLHKGHSVD
jgi:hypothetical protein